MLFRSFFPQGSQTAARHLARAQQVDPRMPGVVAFQPAGQPEGAQLVVGGLAIAAVAAGGPRLLGYARLSCKAYLLARKIYLRA